jgi:hypothetical protein
MILLGKKTCRRCRVNTKRRGSPYCTPCEKEMDDEARAYINAIYPPPKPLPGGDIDPSELFTNLSVSVSTSGVTLSVDAVRKAWQTATIYGHAIVNTETGEVTPTGGCQCGEDE